MDSTRYDAMVAADPQLQEAITSLELEKSQSGGRDGSLLEGDMPRVPGLFMRVPLLRGLARLTMSFSPLMQRDGVAGKAARRVGRGRPGLDRGAAHRTRD